MKKKSETAYDEYVKQYEKNLRQIERYDNPVTAEHFRDKMMTKEMFDASLTQYRAMWSDAHKGRHGESADRIAKWIANRETQDRSYKQAQRIKKTAAELGYDLTTNEIRWGSEKTAAFWNDYALLFGEGLIDNQIWGSP